MLVLNLACGHDHIFEGWFASAEDFESQRQRALLECPICGDRSVERRPSAPRIQTARHPQAPDKDKKKGEADAASVSDTQADATAVLMRAVRHVLAHTEDVGHQFAEEARRIHYGESPERSIRGQSSLQEVVALAEEGISVLPLALPAALKEPLQ